MVLSFLRWFFVANGIFVLAVKRVYAGTLVKNSWYWLKSVPRDLIDRHFENKKVGMVYILEAST